VSARTTESPWPFAPLAVIPPRLSSDTWTSAGLDPYDMVAAVYE
jgi:hypothetical protein